MGIAAPRSAWTTRKPSLAPGPRLVRRVFVHHTAFPDVGGVISEADEHERMRSIEDTHLARGWAAAGYSKVIMGSGRAYDGRGWGFKQGANYDGGTNESTYSICFDGDFTSKSPTEEAMQTFRDLIAEGLAEGWIAPDFELVRHGMEVIPPGLPGAGQTVLAYKGKDCPGAGVYSRFDDLREVDDIVASLTDAEKAELLAGVRNVNLMVKGAERALAGAKSGGKSPAEKLGYRLLKAADEELADK